MIRGLPGHLTSVTPHPPVARTATGDSASVDLKDYIGEVLVYLNVGTVAGTDTPTLTVALHDSANDSAFAALSPAVAFTAKTATGQQAISLDTRQCRRYLRAAYTISGTNPSFTFSVCVHGRKQAQ